MPKYVDHDARRRAVTEVAAELVAAEGRGALTARRVAEAAGQSTTIVSHYFTDMAELLRATNEYAAGRSRARVEAVLATDPADIIGLAEALLPIDAERRADWRIWLAFFGDALGDPDIAAKQRARTRRSSDRFRRCLELLAEQGRVVDGIDVGVVADRIAALVLGIAVDATFDPRTWSAAAQRDAIRSELVASGVGIGLAPATSSTR